tara:strand:+ start:349 stop:1479 length:1131 start_codon:yes stop_codon:yes gene_type:complete
MTVDFKTLRTILPLIADAKHPILLRGRHGIGKSAVVYQFAQSLGLPIVERRASQMTEGDLLGLPELISYEASVEKEINDQDSTPITKGNVTSFCPPDWFARACAEPVALFLDEVDRATLEVRQGIFELCDSRKLAGNTLHPDTIIFAAVNGGVHSGAASYQVGEMDPAELDRYTVFDVSPTVDDWLEWANGSVNSVILDFIRNNPEHLEHNDDPEPNKVYPSRRSWVRFSEASDGMIEPGNNSPTVYALGSAYLGFEAAVAFNDFVADYSKIVTIEDILDRGMLPELDINGHCGLIKKFENSPRLQAALDEKELANLGNYVLTLPSEALMSMWSVIGAGFTDNVVAMHTFKTPSGDTLANHLVRVLSGEDVTEAKV